MQKQELVRELKIRGLPQKYILKRPKRVLLLYLRRFDLFRKGKDIVKGRKYA